MKHLKKYNESKEEEIFTQDVRDICQELQDDGFYIATYVAESEDDKNNVEIYNFHEPLKYDDVHEVILRLRDYLGDKYVRTDIHWVDTLTGFDGEAIVDPTEDGLSLVKFKYGCRWVKLREII